MPWLIDDFEYFDYTGGSPFELPDPFPPPIEGEPNAEEQASIAQLIAFDTRHAGYAKLMSTRPQTAGYGLQDSPVGLAGWIYEKIAEWTQSNLQPETVLTRDEILDDITLYRLTGTATSSSRLYGESFATDNTTQKLDIPVAVCVFPGELFRPLKLWGERVSSNLIY